MGNVILFGSMVCFTWDEELYKNEEVLILVRAPCDNKDASVALREVEWGMRHFSKLRCKGKEFIES